MSTYSYKRIDMHLKTFIKSKASCIEREEPLSFFELIKSLTGSDGQAYSDPDFSPQQQDPPEPSTPPEKPKKPVPEEEPVNPPMPEKPRQPIPQEEPKRPGSPEHPPRQVPPEHPE